MKAYRLKVAALQILFTFLISLISDRPFRTHGLGETISVAVDDFSLSGEKSRAQSRECEVRNTEIEKRWHETMFRISHSPPIAINKTLVKRHKTGKTNMLHQEILEG